MDWSFLNFMAVMLSIGLAASLPFGAIHVFKALATRLERKGGGAAEVDALNRRIVELEEIHFREMEAVSQRVAELEERMDFSERMLTQEKQPGQLKPMKG